jgi:ribosomal protein L11 methyltransferase
LPDHVQIVFRDLQPEQQDVLIARLAAAGFDGFEENEQELKAYIPQQNYDKELLHELAFKYQLDYSEQLIPERNWNEVWESGFAPVVIEDFAGIRAAFHPRLTGVAHEIVITPKMSFGTGHHATTWMMIDQMREIDIKDKNVLDFGTGTGILSILACKLGAASITAIDMDDWSIKNARENFLNNQCPSINLIQSDVMIHDEKFQIILANINKNVILENFKAFVSALENDGFLLLSGLLESDEEELIFAARSFSLTVCKKTQKDHWISFKISH